MRTTFNLKVYKYTGKKIEEESKTLGITYASGTRAVKPFDTNSFIMLLVANSEFSKSVRRRKE